MKKRFIEWDLPLAEISEESAREKNIRHGHISTLHIWWARKPLAASRVTNFTALIDLPDDEEKSEEIYELIKKMAAWEAISDGNDVNIEKARKMIKEQWDEPPIVLDPFSGGGSIPLEALRLGCETYSNDYNPVAVLIEKCTLEYPQKYGIKKEGKEWGGMRVSGKDQLLEDVMKWGEWVLDEVKNEIGKFYQEPLNGPISVGYYWLKTIKCQNPTCGAVIPLASNWWLSNKPNKKVVCKPVVNGKKINFEIKKENFGDFNPNEGTIAGANVVCPVCHQVTEAKRVRELAQSGKMGQRMVVVILHQMKKKGKLYRIANETDMEIFRKAEEYFVKKRQRLMDELGFDPVPDEPTPEGKGRGAERAFSVRNYSLNIWGDLFNSRQKLALITFSEKIRQAHKRMLTEGIEEEYAKAVVSYLALVLNRLAMFSTTLCRWKSGTEQNIPLFSGRMVLPMIFDYFEVVPTGKISTSWINSIDTVMQSLETDKTILNSSVVTQSSATSLAFPDDHFDAVFTDPPYYDNVPYSYLSDFFYVWLKRTIGNIYPDLFSTPLTPKSEEIVAYTHKRDMSEARIYFETMLSSSFKEIHRVLKPNGIATIVYAHKTTSGWESVLNSLVDAGLVVTASWPIHTEMKERLRSVASAALASSIYIVCRKTERKKIGFYSEIQPLIKQRAEEKLQQFWNEGIGGGDFFISAIGPAMEIFSQYERVEKLSGEQVTTAELLDYIRSISTNFIVNKLLQNASSSRIDSPSEFYLAYRWTYMDNTVEYDDARKLASASGFSLEDYWGPNGFIKKSGSKISVLGPKDRDEIDKPKSMADVMHRCLLLWEQGERDEITRVLAETGFKDDPAFKQFCQAVAESLLNGNKEKQLLEGFLIGIDSYTKAKVKKHKDQTGLDQFGGK